MGGGVEIIMRIEKRKIGGVFTAIGVVSLWATIYINKDYILQLLKENNLL